MSNNPEKLRVAAEAKLGDPDKGVLVRPAEELLHELQVHQIELEMQNETLREAQLELEESRDRYLDLYDFAPVAYLTLNQSGMIVEINHTGAELLGIEHSVLINKRFLTFVAPEDHDRWRENFLNLLNHAGTGSCEMRLQRQDGSRFYARCESRCLNGDVRAVRITLTDNTARRQTETRLRESEEKLRAIYEGALDGILLVNLENLRFENGNPALCRMLGYSLEELALLGVADIHLPEDLPWIIEDFGMHLRGERDMSADIPVLRRDGSVFYVDIKSSIVLIDNKNYILGIFRDVTARRQAEIGLRESEEKFHAIFEGTLNGVVLIDETGMIADFNPEFMRQSGMTFDQLKQTRIWELRPAGKAELARNIFFEVMKTGLCRADDFKFKKPDGKVIHIGIRGAPISIGGKHYLQCITHDISERKKTEIELREYQMLLRELAAQGAASREAERRHIAREVHDELGQLLTALRMDISLLRIQFGADNPVLMPKIQDMLNLVDKAIQGARDVTANLHPPALDMGIVSALTWLSNEFAARTSISCSLQVNDKPHDLDDARTLTLFRIVQESLTNVTRYAQATHVEIVLGKRGENVTVQIRDDGTGFEPDAVPAVKSFGLMGMRERALAVSGKVEITSAPGQGAVVFVEIPVSGVKPGRRIND
ncbi:MAG: PAS domain S-box protein [Proteobacteria bacterium]|nr:PAS domain S-box protein [Pseudomonadota bacterium]